MRLVGCVCFPVDDLHDDPLHLAQSVPGAVLERSTPSPWKIANIAGKRIHENSMPRFDRASRRIGGHPPLDCDATGPTMVAVNDGSESFNSDICA